MTLCAAQPQDDSLAAHNLTLVAAHLHTAGAVDAGLLFSLLDFLTDRCGGVLHICRWRNLQTTA